MPARKQRSEAELAARDVPLELGVQRRGATCSSWTTTSLELHDHLDWAPSARIKVGKDLYGPYTADMAAPRPLPVELKFVTGPRPARTWPDPRRRSCSGFMQQRPKCVLSKLYNLLGNHASSRLQLPPLAVLELHEARPPLRACQERASCRARSTTRRGSDAQDGP